MNKPDRRLDRLLDAAREAPPLLSDEGTDRLLNFADRRRLTVLGLALLHGYLGITTAAASVAIGAAALFMYVSTGTSPSNRAVKTEKNPVQASAPADATPSVSLQDAASAAVASADLPGPPRETPRAMLHPTSQSQTPFGANTEPAYDYTRDASPPSVACVEGTTVPQIRRTTVPGSMVVNGASLLLTPVDAETSAFPTVSPAAESFTDEGIAFFVEGGALQTVLRSGFKNPVRGTDVNAAPQNFGAATGGAGLRVAAGISLPLTPWLRAMGTIGVAQFTSTYSSPDVSFVPSQNGPGGMTPVQVEHLAALKIGTITVAPALRAAPFALPVFLDAGIAAGLVYRQSADYSTVISAVQSGAGNALPVLPTPSHSSSIGRARVQWDLLLGLGAEIPLSPALRIDAELRGQYGLAPLFADNYPRAFSVTPLVGVRFVIP